MARPRKYSDELRRRAIDEVVVRGRKIPDVARDLGIGSPETLRAWVRQAEIDRGLKAGPTTDELAEIRQLRREVADQQRTIEILKAATTFSHGRPTRDSGEGRLRRRAPRPVAGGGHVRGHRRRREVTIPPRRYRSCGRPTAPAGRAR